MQNSDRTYQFISDPSHKENLSGRVTAACLQCRRKKIKCSGDGPCRQCQEKGIQCDGPPSRKRPKRDHLSGEPGASIEGEPPSDAGSSGGVRSNPVPSLSHEDSGYRTGSLSSRTPSSTSQSNDSDTTTIGAYNQSPRSLQNRRPSQLRIPTRHSSETGTDAHSTPTHSASSQFAFDVRPTMTRYNDVREFASPLASSEWSFVPTTSAGGAGLANYPIGTSFSGSPGSVQPRSGALSINSEPMGQASRRGSEPWWSADANTQGTPAELIQAAEALEGQAQGLRWLASRRHSEDTVGAQASYQPQSHFTAQTLQSPHASPFSISNVPDAFNAASFFRPDGTLRSGFTPGATEAVSYWDVRPTISEARQPLGAQMTTAQEPSGGGYGSSSTPSQPRGMRPGTSAQLADGPDIQTRRERPPSNEGKS